MSKYRDIVFMILDEVKLTSDDSHFQPEHVIFLIDKYRVFLIKQRYSDIKKEVPDSNFQTICVTLELAPPLKGLCSSGEYLKSVEKIPYLSTVSTPKVSPINFFSGDFAYVSNERFRYAGSNKYLNNQIYSTISPDNHLYVKSGNPQFKYLKKVKVTGVFEDSLSAASLQCDNDSESCELLDKNFPLEDALIPPLIELVVKELNGAKYQAEDKENNAKDDLSDIAAYIRQQLANGRRSDLYKEYN